MRRISFVLAILGILILLVILVSQKPISISSYEELANLTANSKIITSGFVIQQTSYSIKLDNNLSLYCNNCPSCKNKNVSIIGIIEDYNNKKEINVLKIKIIR